MTHTLLALRRRRASALARLGLTWACAGLGGLACGVEDAPTAPADDAPATSAPTGDETVAEAVAATCTQNPYKNLYWGDLHTHTSYSLDAYTFGTRVDPAGALAFARRQTSVTIASGSTPAGPTVTIDRPLDFAAVTDHSEWLSSAYGCTQTGSPYYDSPYCQDLRAQDTQAQQTRMLLALAQAAAPTPTDPGICRTQPAACAAQQRTAWQRIRQAADAANVPCSFTAFPAYEWTRTTLGANLHRNVIFNGTGVPAQPYDALAYPAVRDLWTALDGGCTAASGCRALTIPHNSNGSQGRMFQFDPADVPQMSRYQRLVELFQHKGNSECLSPTDPADAGFDPQCSFEQLPDQTQERDRPGYVRSALGQGLQQWRTQGNNPLAMGFVGAVDTHNATPGEVAEGGFGGHLGQNDNAPAERLSTNFRDFNPGGITAVWAEENSRASIFAALERRETYATSGPRIAVRFYQYWGTLDPCADPDFPRRVVDAGGVPMGGVMTARPVGRPRFVVLAQQDARALARVDIIKGRATPQRVVENVFTLPSSGGSRVCLSWQDPDYDPRQPAYYYARVLESPSERWSTYDCLADPSAAPAECARCTADPITCRTSGSLNHTIQESAWTSPIFQLP